MLPSSGEGGYVCRRWFWPAILRIGLRIVPPNAASLTPIATSIAQFEPDNAEKKRGMAIAMPKVFTMAGVKFMEYPFKKILCPIDFDDNSVSALAAAAEMARHAGATIEVFHAVPIAIQPVEAPIFIDVSSANEQESRRKLVELAKIHLAGVKYELKTVTVSQPSAAILHEQETSGADVIVLSTHGRSGLSHLFLGSVAERVVREAQCPVLTIRGRNAKKQSATAHATTAR